MRLLAMRFMTTAALMLAVVVVTWAQEYAPRVVSEHNANVYSLKTLAKFRRWRDLKGDARTWEIYRYLADLRTGLFHLATTSRKGTNC